MKFFKDLSKYRNYIFYSARSSLQSEVAGSFLNWIWWVLEPLCFMGIYTFVFSIFFKGTVKYLPVFIFIGITMWEFFNNMAKTSVRLVRSNKPIVSKVYLPKYILILDKMAMNGFKSAISYAIVIVFMLIYRVPLSWNVLWALPILASYLIFTFGVCSILLHFGVYVEDLANLTNIALRLMFYATGVFYNLADKIAGPIGYWILRLNPMALYLNCMRDALLYQRMPNLIWLGGWTVIGILLSVIGVTLIRKNENSYVKVL